MLLNSLKTLTVLALLSSPLMAQTSYDSWLETYCIRQAYTTGGTPAASTRTTAQAEAAKRQASNNQEVCIKPEVWVGSQNVLGFKFNVRVFVKEDLQLISVPTEIKDYNSRLRISNCNYNRGNNTVVCNYAKYDFDGTKTTYQPMFFDTVIFVESGKEDVYKQTATGTFTTSLKSIKS